jgi:hypothetical protein
MAVLEDLNWRLGVGMAVLEDLYWRLGEAWSYIHSSSTPLQISINKCETK